MELLEWALLIGSPILTYWIFSKTKIPVVHFEHEDKSHDKSYSLYLHNFGDGMAKIIDFYFEINGEEYSYNNHTEMKEELFRLLDQKIEHGEIEITRIKYSSSSFEPSDSVIARNSKYKVFSVDGITRDDLRTTVDSFKVVVKYKSFLPTPTVYINSQDIT